MVCLGKTMPLPVTVQRAAGRDCVAGGGTTAPQATAPDGLYLQLRDSMPLPLHCQTLQRSKKQALAAQTLSAVKMRVAPIRRLANFSTANLR
jgi:hypothetical protein